MNTIHVSDGVVQPAASVSIPVAYASTDQYGVPIAVTATTSLLTTAPQIDIIKPGRRYVVQQPPCLGAMPQEEDAGGFCLTFRGVAYQNLNPGYNINTVFPYELRGIWNPEVGPVATATNGVTVHLSPEAQDQIRNKYVDGRAVRVRLFKFKLFHCPDNCCKRGGGCNCGACCDCNRRLVVDDFFPVYDILFGKADQEASCPNIVTKLCFCPLFFWLCESTVDIDIRDVQVKGAPVKQWMA